VDPILRQSPDMVMRRISTIIGGTGIETAKKTIESKIRTLKGSLDSWNKVYDMLHTRISEVWSQVPIVDLEENYAELRNRADHAERLSQTILRIKGLLATYNEKGETLNSVNKAYASEAVAQHIKNAAQIEADVVALKSRIERIKRIHKKIEDIRSKDLTLASQKLDAVKDYIDSIRYTDFDGLKTRINTIKNSWKKYQENEKTINNLLADIDKINKEIEDYVPAEPICPTCNQRIEVKHDHK